MYFLDRFIDNIFSAISKKILGKSINTPSPRANPCKLFDLYMEFFAIKLSHCIVGTFFYMLQMFKLNRENRKTSKCKFGFD